MTSYSFARRSAAQHLREKARAGKREVGFLLDMETGQQLDYQEATEGNPDEIAFLSREALP